MVQTEILLNELLSDHSDTLRDNMDIKTLESTYAFHGSIGPIHHLQPNVQYENIKIDTNISL